MLASHRAKVKAVVEAQAHVAQQVIARAGDDTQAQRQAVADTLATLRFRTFVDEDIPTGICLCLRRAGGVCVASPTKRESEGKNFWDTKDEYGVFLFREMAQQCAKGGRFVEYHWAKPGSDQPEPKVSYAMFIPGARIMLGSGVYIEDVQQHLAEVRVEMDHDHRQL
jgi:methyl-accepting chemotaxis protein